MNTKGLGPSAPIEPVTESRGWVLDRKANDWPFWLDHPTAWVEWLNKANEDHVTLPPGSFKSLPIAGVAQDNWNFAALAKRGDQVGLLDMAIEANKKTAFYILLDALDWTSAVVKKESGILAGRCIASSTAATPSINFVLEAGLEMLRRGALAPWRCLSQHTLFCLLPDKMLKGKNELLEMQGIPGEEMHCLPLPMALILDPNMGLIRHEVFKLWVSSDLGSMALAHFMEGASMGGGIFHACVWGSQQELLRHLLKTEATSLLATFDGHGRSPLHLATELGLHSIENDLRTYNGRQIADQVLRLI